MKETMVATCIKCRAWYNMDMEYGLDDEHFNFRTGEPCIASDDDWAIFAIPHRHDWYNAR